MTWNYRIIRYKNGDYGLHEVHYSGDIPDGRTEKPVSFACNADEGKKGIIKSLKLALADAESRPVIVDLWHME